MILEYRQIEEGVILPNMSEYSSRNPRAGEEVILSGHKKIFQSKLSKESHGSYQQNAIGISPNPLCSHHLYCSLNSPTTGNHSHQQRKQNLAKVLSRVGINGPTSTFEVFVGTDRSRQLWRALSSLESRCWKCISWDTPPKNTFYPWAGKAALGQQGILIVIPNGELLQWEWQILQISITLGL